MFVASHKHKQLKGLIGQISPLRLQDVLALAEELLNSSTRGDWRGEHDEENLERNSHQLHSIRLVNNVRAPFHERLYDGTKSVILWIHVFFARYSLKLAFKKY